MKRWNVSIWTTKNDRERTFFLDEILPPEARKFSVQTEEAR